MSEEQINDIVELVHKKLASLPSSTSQPSIYKIPRHLFEVNKKAYLPTVVSIGPIHYQKPYVQETQELKSQHLQCFLQETSHLCSLEDYLRILRDNEGKARSCYAESVSLFSNEFILMLLIDAVFVLNYLMWRNKEVRRYCPGSNLILKRSEIYGEVRRDILLAENQIPFFVLQMIYDISFGTIYPYVTVTDLACSFVKFTLFDIDEERVKEEQNIEHLVDFMWKSLKPSATYVKKHEYHLLCSSVTHLQAVGVKFQATESKNMLDITFNEGVLRIPKLKVTDATASVYRNILAFEQCHLYSDYPFTDCMIFLAELIRTPGDVRILIRSGIIENWLGNEDVVAHLFNNIIEVISFSGAEYYFSDISKRLNEHASTKFNEWKAILKRDYFSHPWTIISLIYALILLVLTVLQTIGTFTQH